MPSIARRKKHPSHLHTSKVAPSRQKGIQAFSTITKAHIHETGKSTTLKRKHDGDASDIENQRPGDQESKTKKLKTASEQPLHHVQVVVPTKAAPSKVLGRRKRDEYEEPSTPPPPEPKQKQKQKQKQSHTAEHNSKHKKTLTRPQRPSDTPTKGARSLLENFAFAASSPSAKKQKTDTPPSSPQPLDEPNSSTLPSELQDLITLHSSLLTALSLHHAHNGLSNPADLRTLYPSIESTWKKRSVTLSDIRRLLAIPPSTSNPFHLTDHGQSKITLDLSDPSLSDPSPINIPALQTAFTTALTQKWTTTRNPPPTNPTTLLTNLPLLPLTPAPLPASILAQNAKGHSRLADLKATALAAQSRHQQQQKHHPPTTPNPTTTTISISNPKARASLLLSRLASKPAPTPVSPAHLARTRALHRLPEITPVLHSLALSRQRHDYSDTSTSTSPSTSSPSSATVLPAGTKQRHVSFSMAALVQDLQTSVRNPISREEAVLCVRCLAEVAPEWVGVWEVGGVCGVVVKGEGVGAGVVGGRVRGLVGGGVS